ncbi:MAG: hypothetical protein U1C18_02430 [Patescibacteria group bacterium]|nr:hypothetical protein [bacterium]MDZ4221707.1 hypothetical protein [Patescibacteria group bacterium]
MNPFTKKLSVIFAAVLAVGLVVGSTRAANLTNVSIALSNHKPSQTGVTQTITFTPATTISGAGDLKITWPAGFDFTNVIASADVSVSGGGATWEPVVNGNLVIATRVLTLGWTGALSAGSPVTVTVGFTKNPAAGGNYNITIQTGTDGFAAATDSRTVPVVIVDAGVAVSAEVPYPPTEPSVANISPVETIVVSSGAAQVISFDLTDVNDEDLDYTVAASSGTISVSPSPATPITASTKNGVTVSFTYFADGSAGNQTITVLVNEVGGVDAFVQYDIDLFVI